MKQIYRNSRELEKYYRFLFKLPSLKVIVVVVVSIFLITYLLLKTSGSILVFYFIIVTISLTVYSRICSGSIFSKFKRTIVLSIVSITYSLIVSLFTNLIIGLVSSIVILIIVIQSLDGNSIYRYVVATIPLYTTVFILYFNKMITVNELYLCIVASMLLILLDYMIFIVLSRYRVNGFKSVDLGTLYMWNWLEKRRDIENIFEKLGSNYLIKPCLLKSSDSVLIYTDIHYGPFSNTGSSELPRVLTRFLKGRGYCSIVFHGTGGHERDLPHSKYIDLFINKIEELINSRGVLQKYHGLFKYINWEWEVTGIVFTDVSLIFVSRPSGGIDDLPYGLQESIDKEACARDLGRVLVIDTHNWELETDPDVDRLENILRDSLKYIELLKRSKPVDVLTRSVCINEKLPGVIDGEVCLFELKGIDERGHLILVYFRGNNIDPGLRNRIINYIRGKYSRAVVEVLTNDEHSETGVYVGASYIPVRDCPELYSVLDKLMNMIEQKSYSRELYLNQESVEYPLISNNVYKLVELLEKIYPLAVITLISYILAAPVLTYILYRILVV